MNNMTMTMTHIDRQLDAASFIFLHNPVKVDVIRGLGQQNGCTLRIQATDVANQRTAVAWLPVTTGRQVTVDIYDTDPEALGNDCLVSVSTDADWLFNDCGVNAEL